MRLEGLKTILAILIGVVSRCPKRRRSQCRHRTSAFGSRGCRILGDLVTFRSVSRGWAKSCFSELRSRERPQPGGLVCGKSGRPLGRGDCRCATISVGDETAECTGRPPRMSIRGPRGPGSRCGSSSGADSARLSDRGPLERQAAGRFALDSLFWSARSPFRTRPMERDCRRRDTRGHGSRHCCESLLSRRVEVERIGASAGRTLADWSDQRPFLPPRNDRRKLRIGWILSEQGEQAG